ncbi:hypothetical protein [Streptomyces johnsoniae]|uniref:4-hydroxybenzoate synthetase n=1 Tax=Streptomyces johnsoniae TaxID=3075532 RepID=A0ABU2SG80_9ACTN|nr:hypothetical protein [Streptomyces sp. DSM 41886]MDT0447095.1 hypothetical protein [Streptomyces sp. DSM 41886]
MSVLAPNNLFPHAVPRAFPLDVPLDVPLDAIFGAALGGAADPRNRVRGFASPVTRMLLSSDGLTTTLLEALAGESLHLHCLAQLRTPAQATGDGVPALLRTDRCGEVLVRYSATTRPGGQALSVNHVVARVGLAPGIEPCLTSRSIPLGPALHAAGTGHRRTLLDVGRRPWQEEDGTERTACYKTYLVWHGDDPLALINELFSPAAVPAA